MYQHIIQNSWLKQFASRGYVKSVDFHTLNFELKKPDCIGGDVDFQSEEQERNDSKVIESPAIAILHSIKKGKLEPNDTQRGHLNRFVALHMSRSTRDLENLKAEGISFKQAKNVLYESSLLFSSSFPEIWTLHLKEGDERLILSDQPIVRMEHQILLPYAPKVLICFTDSRGPGVFEDRTWSQAMNEMSIQNSVNSFFCNPDKHPDLLELMQRSKRNIIISKECHTLRIPPVI